MQFFNQYRKGLRSFIIKTRDGHPVGYLWAQTRYAALNRAERLAGHGASADFYGIDINLLTSRG
jgi:hypothetical protein